MMCTVDSEVYARQLLPKGLGYPLWGPEPCDDLPSEYKRHGVAIGDVGIITSDGAFDYIFNILLSPDNPENSAGVPRGFEQVVLNRPGDLLSRLRQHPPGSHVASMSIYETEQNLDISSANNLLTPVGVAASMMFCSSSQEGAVLALPNGASQTNLRRLHLFQEYALKHGENWYEFVNGELGRMAPNGSLYLVTGCDKASSWGVASFSNTSTGGKVMLKFTAAQVAEGNTSYGWRWQTFSPAATRTGPCFDASEQDLPQNQCVFLRGYKVSVRGVPMTMLKGPVKVSSIVASKFEDILSSGSFIPYTGGSKPSLFSRHLGGGGPKGPGSDDSFETNEQYGADVMLEHIPELVQPYHPLTAINNYLLESMPDARVAVTHDNDWCAVLDNNTELPEDAVLLCRIRERYEPLMEHGGVSLKKIIENPKSPLTQVPADVLEHIAFQLVQSEPFGPPSALIPLLSTCLHINKTLAFDNCPWLYTQIYKSKFDTSAIRRRRYNIILAERLRGYCCVLQYIRRGDIFHERVPEVFWTVFIMLSEDDGKNKSQLEWAGLDDFVDRFIKGRLYEGRQVHQGWPMDNNVNALALWILWMMTTREKLAAESESSRQQIIDIVLPYAMFAFRYPCTLVPPNHFEFPLPAEWGTQALHSVATVHDYALYRRLNELEHTFTQYSEKITLARPFIAIAAKLIYFSRREMVPFHIPPHMPLTRAHLGLHTNPTPTQEDVIEFNAHRSTKLPPPTKWTWHDELTTEEMQHECVDLFPWNLKSPSAKWDKDWKRWSFCSNPSISSKGTMYTPGTLTGLWRGRMRVPTEGRDMQRMAMSDYPPDFSEANPVCSTVPIYMQLREHHCVSPARPLGCGGRGDSFLDAHFPSMRIIETPPYIQIKTGETSTVYEQFIRGQPDSHNEDTCTFSQTGSVSFEYESDFAEVGLGMGVHPPDRDDGKVCRDIIFLGETNLRHGQAWNHFTYFGRLRTWDGLIAILRVPRDDQGLGRMIFYGYIIGGQNFIGNWRLADQDVRASYWEGPFTMSRHD